MIQYRHGRVSIRMSDLKIGEDFQVEELVSCHFLFSFLMYLDTGPRRLVCTAVFSYIIYFTNVYIYQNFHLLV